MPVHLNNIDDWNIHLGSIEICNVYVGSVLIRSCETIGVYVANNSDSLTETIYTFSLSSFTKDFSAEGNTYKNVIIKTLPDVPQLKYLGVIVREGDTIAVLNSSGLKFELSDAFAVYNGIAYEFDKEISLIIEEYAALGYALLDNIDGTLTFKKSDTDIVYLSGRLVDAERFAFDFVTTDTADRESNVAQWSFVPTGFINARETTVNQPPSAVGSTSIAVQTSEVYEYTVADFTTKSTPNYADPENDDPFELIVDSLPEFGWLRLRGVDITVGQVLSFPNDIAVGELTYTPDPERLDVYTEWTSRISDFGSKQFRG